MTYISLYRKWRSQNFEEIIGQEAVVKTLQNAIQFNRLSHAYLFSGPRGTGKTSTARILAKALNCKNGPTPHPCEKCDLCQRIRDGQCVDVIEIDAASNRGIDQIRDLRERVRFAPVEGKYKVYIIDEVHMLTAEAFNALLKTLEEPPEHVVFILATTDPQKVPVTIWSRCQRLDFRRIPQAQIVAQLEKVAKDEKIKIEERALYLISRAAAGSLRDAISLLDQLVAFAGSLVKVDDVIMVLGGAEEGALFQFAAALAQGQAKTVLELLEQNLAEGRSVLQVTKDLTNHFRYLLFAKMGVEKLIDLSTDQVEEVKKQSQAFSEDHLKKIVRILCKAELDMRWQPQARIVLEGALLEIVLEKGTKAETKAETKVETKIEAKAPIAKETGEAIDVVLRHWGEILEKVKSKTLFGYVSLHEGRPMGLNGDNKLIVEYKKGFSFHKQRLEDAANKKAVEEAILEVTGLKLSIEARVLDHVEDRESGTAAFSLDKIKEMFGGKVLS